MTKIVFVDTETTSLRPDRRAWDVGLIVRADGADPEDTTADTEMEWMVGCADLDLGNADLMSLKIGRFYDRHPGGWYDKCMSEHHVMREVEEATRGAVMVGANVHFDLDVLATRMRAQGICPSWHYSPVDVKSVAVGWFNARRQLFTSRRDSSFPVEPPYRFDDILDRLALELADERAAQDHPKPIERHTAIGDARLVRDLYNVVTGVRS